MASSASGSTARALADITDAGAFGPGSRFVSFEPSGRRPPLPGRSVVLYGTLTVSDQEVRRHHRIAVKLKHRTTTGSRAAFHNETLFYERIVPFLLDCAMASEDALDHVPPLCHYFYGRNDCSDRSPSDMIVLEDATAIQGYRWPDDRSRFLDFDHLVVALRTLAKFHGLSYRAKHADPTGFNETVAGIEDTQLRFDGDIECTVDGSYAAHAELFSAALDQMVTRHGECELTRRFRAEVLHDDAVETMRRAMMPVEPLSVLCHGHFDRDELLFRYDEEDPCSGSTASVAAAGPVEVIPLDMAAVRYGSPALDLSYLLYVNADHLTRDRHWDELLDEYCAALSIAVSDALEGSVVPVLDRARLDVEMREHAFYGLASALSYVRMPTTTIGRRSPDDSRPTTAFVLSDDETICAIADAIQHFLYHIHQ